MKMFRKKDEGFTLVELMVVVLIIGILVAIAIPVFNAARANAQKKSCYANQRTIEGACQTYQAENMVLPGTVATLTPTYIKVAPACPQTGSTSAGGYSLTTTPGDTVVDCTHSTEDDHGHF